MIYAYLDPCIEEMLKNVLKDVLCDMEISIETNQISHTFYDVYFIEVNTRSDLERIERINRTYSPLIYVVGLRDYDLISDALSKNINMYFDKNNLIEDFFNKKEALIKQILNRCSYYLIQRGFTRIKLRTSQIMYVESMNHEIVIHSTSGEIIERKALSQFLDAINSSNFIQVHKSFVVNSSYISHIKNKQVILKNGVVIPIGKKYDQITITI